MFKRASLTWLLAIALLPALAQNALLYKVSGKGLQQPSYLYGTIHLICPADLQISPAMQNAIKTARSVYFEVDMDDPGMEEAMRASMNVDENYELKNLFKPADYARLGTYLRDSLQVDVEQLQKMKPLVLQVMMLMRGMDCQLPSSYEQELLKIALEQKKPVEGLETIGEQMALLHSMSDSAMAVQVMEMVDTPRKHREMFASMISAYKKQDVNTLFALRLEGPQMPGMNEMLLDKRNRSWIPVMEKAMRQGPVFVACGAMHLAGDQGLLALLKAQGYEVTPVL